MDRNRARSRNLVLAVLDLGSHDLIRCFLIDIPLGIHTGKDAGSADCHVGLAVGDQDRRGNAVVSAAGRVRSVDTYDHRNT